MNKTVEQRQADIAKGFRWYVVNNREVVSRHKTYAAASKSAARQFGSVGIREITI